MNVNGFDFDSMICMLSDQSRWQPLFSFLFATMVVVGEDGFVRCANSSTSDKKPAGSGASGSSLKGRNSIGGKKCGAATTRNCDGTCSEMETIDSQSVVAGQGRAFENGDGAAQES